ncbi:hypothetical protein [Tessaracoccus sp.]
MKPRSHATVRDAGYTLGEILVAMTLFVAVSTITGTLIVEANQAARKTTSSAFVQSQMLDVVSRISREVSVANPILVAEPAKLETLTVRDGKAIRTQFRYDATSGKIVSRSAKAGVAGEPAPPLPAMTDPIDTLVSPYTKVAWDMAATGGLNLTYFDNSEKAVRVDAAGVVAAADLKTIGRVAVTLAAKQVSGRSAQSLTLKTSMATRLGMPAAGFAGPALTGPAAAAASCPELTATSGPNDATLTWDAVFGATGYDITRSPTWSPAETHNQAGTTFADPALPDGGNFTYTVTPVGLATTPDCTGSAATVNLVPGKPVLTGEVTGTYDITLTWSPVPNANGYILQKDGVTIQTFGSVIPGSYVDKGVAPGVTYTYTVIAMNATGNSVSNPVAVPVIFTGATDTFTVPSGPLDITETGNLTWLFPNNALVAHGGGNAVFTTPIGSNPMAVVNTGTPNVDAQIPTVTGGEALVVRVQDGANWLRARSSVVATTVDTYSTQNQYAQVSTYWVDTSYSQAYTYYTSSGWVYQGAYCGRPDWNPMGWAYWYWDNSLGDYTRMSLVEYNYSCTYQDPTYTVWKHWWFQNLVANTGYYTVYSGYWNSYVSGYYWAFSRSGGSDYATGTTRQVLTGSVTTTAKKVFLDKSVNGTVSTLATYPVASFGVLRVVANGDQIKTYSDGTLLGTLTEPAFQTATQVGVGLGGPTYGPAATWIGNFAVMPTP